jgi:hypothetical protein
VSKGPRTSQTTNVWDCAQPLDSFPYLPTPCRNDDALTWDPLYDRGRDAGAFDLDIAKYICSFHRGGNKSHCWGGWEGGKL